MSTTNRRRAAVAAAALMTLFGAGTAGCASGGGASEEAPKAQASPQRKAEEGLVGILVAGRSVTGTKPSGIDRAPYQRTYTDGELYSAVTGYRSLVYGASGLESIYRDVRGTVETTIDPALQRAAAEGLRGHTGAAVALDAETGRIRALVSAPSYDPSTFSGNTRADAGAWKELNAKEDHPLLNRALRQAVPAGRTFHVVVAAAALEKGLYASMDTPTRAPGGTGGCENASISHALRDGCDDVFTAMAAEVGREAVRSTAEAFGFNEKELDVPVRAVESTFGDEEAEATPLQMARVMAVIGNGGKQIGPRLVDRIAHGDGSVQKPKAYAAAGRQVIKQETAAQLRSALASGQLATRTDSDKESWSVALLRTANGGLLGAAVRADGSGPGGTVPSAPVMDRMAKAATG
ncbi:penicillin-binding transpeptidase domain-containing protein [Streptomyces telluris]|uniref:Penicillin-binding transpeptidase domain-containing protein n=1 Tax=Streptomyces telluris TaxID=2720021 RepID=A0A9X2LKX2_9ACTN|nr:penicillin-binding transpeptidase domain-containing protein [Streptomyces telluris]MCQ8773646.1 penicillin-binding transpeptidase domain-containing protein [Streptomyces telluris]NJP79767.1 penicillin-binding protein [Streptomyces telluris]